MAIYQIPMDAQAHSSLSEAQPHIAWIFCCCKVAKCKIASVQNSAGTSMSCKQEFISNTFIQDALCNPAYRCLRMIDLIHVIILCDSFSSFCYILQAGIVVALESLRNVKLHQFHPVPPMSPHLASFKVAFLQLRIDFFYDLSGTPKTAVLEVSMK